MALKDMLDMVGNLKILVINGIILYGKPNTEILDLSLTHSLIYSFINTYPRNYMNLKFGIAVNLMI